MAIFKNKIPILEYDDDIRSIIMPNHANLEIELPSKCLFTFLGDALDRLAENYKARIVTTFDSITKIYPIYIIYRVQGRGYLLGSSTSRCSSFCSNLRLVNILWL